MAQPDLYEFVEPLVHRATFQCVTKFQNLIKSFILT